MIKTLHIISVVIIVIHGLIHLMGLVAYWPLGVIEEIPYKTEFLGGRINLGDAGTRIMSVLWLLAAAGFVVGGAALLRKAEWALPVLIITAVISILITGLDWSVAFRGTLISIVLTLVFIVVLGLRLPSGSFREIVSGTVESPQADTSGLPEAVQLYYEALGTQAVPPLQSAVVQGQATTIVNGISLSTRFQFYHDVENAGYYHHMEATWYSIPFMRIHERLLDGHGVLDLGPLGRVEDEPKIDHAAIQGFWAETMGWLPGMILTDERLVWEEIDGNTARVFLPGVDEAEALTLRFDPDTHLLTEIQAMRYAEASDSERTLWTNRLLEWGTLDGYLIPVKSEIQWADDVPWATWTIEHIAFNGDVQARMENFGTLEE